MKPGQGPGYVDQQTGAHIGENTTYPEFEATRPTWHQMPSAVQISAASNITFEDCSFTQLGGGGIGIGNDPNAHISGVGLGVSHITIRNGYFTQVQGNSITAGGVQADAHHPPDPRMVNSHINIEGNIFFNNSALYSSTVAIFVSYVQNSTILHNDISEAPYSGICHGYGWGSNDAGGSDEYRNRGLYQYQPVYDTDTTSKNNLIQGNLIHGYGRSHTDLGAMYTLARSSGTLLTENYVFDSTIGFGIYPDEASRNMTYSNNVCFSDGPWYAANDWSPDLHTGENVIIDNWGKAGDDTLVGQPDGTGRRGNTFLRNYVVDSLSEVSAAGQRVAYRAGVLPGNRSDRQVTNDENLADGYISLGPSDDGTLIAVNVTNFDDIDFKSVIFEVNTQGGMDLEPVDTPTSIPADSFAVATYRLDGGSGIVDAKASVSYENPRTGQSQTMSVSGVVELDG